MQQSQVPDAVAAVFGFGMISILIGIACFIWWIFCIIDVLKSDFTNPNNKVVWVLVLLLLGPFGLILYLAIGKSQRVGGSDSNRYKEELLSRLRPDTTIKKDFDIGTTRPTVKEKSTRTVQEILNAKKKAVASDAYNNSPTESKDICHTCGKQMKLRTANKGENSGKQFWVCIGYPECKNVIPAV